MPPTFPLELFAESAVSADLDRAIRGMLCLCFPADAELFAAARCWHDSLPAFTVVCRPQDRVIGHVAIVERQVAWGVRRQAVVAGVQSLAVLPAVRRTGLSVQLMTCAMDEARRRGIPFGLLFCVPELEPFYSRLGWQRTDQPVTMQDEHGRPAPLPEKNIAMYQELADTPFPEGPLDLCGRDW